MSKFFCSTFPQLTILAFALFGCASPPNNCPNAPEAALEPITLKTDSILLGVLRGDCPSPEFNDSSFLLSVTGSITRSGKPEMDVSDHQLPIDIIRTNGVLMGIEWLASDSGVSAINRGVITVAAKDKSKKSYRFVYQIQEQ